MLKHIFLALAGLFWNKDFYQWMYQMYLPHVPVKLIFCLILERKDLEAGVLDITDKGSKSKK